MKKLVLAPLKLKTPTTLTPRELLFLAGFVSMTILWAICFWRLYSIQTSFENLFSTHSVTVTLSPRIDK